MQDMKKNRTAIAQALQLQLDRVQNQLAKLTDLLIESTIDKSLFQDKQQSLLLEQARIKENLVEVKAGSSAAANMEKLSNSRKARHLYIKWHLPNRSANCSEL